MKDFKDKFMIKVLFRDPSYKKGAVVEALYLKSEDRSTYTLGWNNPHGNCTIYGSRASLFNTKAEAQLSLNRTIKYRIGRIQAASNFEVISVKLCKAEQVLKPVYGISSGYDDTPPEIYTHYISKEQFETYPFKKKNNYFSNKKTAEKRLVKELLIFKKQLNKVLSKVRRDLNKLEVA